VTLYVLLRQAVIVGGGPVGLAAALTLSNSPHCYNFIVLEKTSGQESVARYDPSRAYLYNVNALGQEWLMAFRMHSRSSKHGDRLGRAEQKRLYGRNKGS